MFDMLFFRRGHVYQPQARVPGGDSDFRIRLSHQGRLSQSFQCLILSGNRCGRHDDRDDVFLFLEKNGLPENIPDPLSELRFFPRSLEYGDGECLFSDPPDLPKTSLKIREILGCGERDDDIKSTVPEREAFSGSLDNRDPFLSCLGKQAEGRIDTDDPAGKHARKTSPASHIQEEVIR